MVAPVSVCTEMHASQTQYKCCNNLNAQAHSQANLNAKNDFFFLLLLCAANLKFKNASQNCYYYYYLLFLRNDISSGA